MRRLVRGLGYSWAHYWGEPKLSMLELTLALLVDNLQYIFTLTKNRLDKVVNSLFRMDPWNRSGFPGWNAAITGFENACS